MKEIDGNLSYKVGDIFFSEPYKDFACTHWCGIILEKGALDDYDCVHHFSIGKYYTTQYISFKWQIYCGYIKQLKGIFYV